MRMSLSAAQGPVRQTAPLENTQQPDFLNQVVCVNTSLDPRGLLELLLDVESALGRVRDVPKGPRTIDCDILLYGNLVLDSPELVLPHPAITTRPFVTEQLVELDAEIRDPRNGQLLREVCNGFETAQCG